MGRTDWRRGLLAGAAGTLTLNMTTYIDMAVRGRPASDVPADTVERLAEAAGVPLGEKGSATRDNRRQGLGALSGYVAGLGVGLLFALAPGRPGRRPFIVEAAVLTAGALLAGNLPATLSGSTDPSTWSAGDWLADAIPHTAYGVVAASTFRLVGR